MKAKQKQVKTKQEKSMQAKCRRKQIQAKDYPTINDKVSKGIVSKYKTM